MRPCLGTSLGSGDSLPPRRRRFCEGRIAAVQIVCVARLPTQKWDRRCAKLVRLRRALRTRVMFWSTSRARREGLCTPQKVEKWTAGRRAGKARSPASRRFCNAQHAQRRPNAGSRHIRVPTVGNRRWDSKCAVRLTLLVCLTLNRPARQPGRDHRMQCTCTRHLLVPPRWAMGDLTIHRVTRSKPPCSLPR